MPQPSHPNHHQRRSIRLLGYDYTQAGAYFITICSRDRACFFADIQDQVARLTPIGEVVAACWEAIPHHFAAAELDAFVVMPNHLHGIVVLGGGLATMHSAANAVATVRDAAGHQDTACPEDTACRVPTKGGSVPGGATGYAAAGERFGAPVAGSIPTIVRSFKGSVTKAINDDPQLSAACRTFLADRLGPLPPGRMPSPWQPRFHEHIVRNDRALDRLRVYIAANPVRWREDTLHPDRVGPW